MQPYPGIDFPAPSTGIVPASPAPGTGVFPTPLVMTTDPRSAANMMAAPEANRDALVFLLHRMINIVDGSPAGGYQYTSTISIKNTFNFTGTVNLSGPWNATHDGTIGGGATLFVGSLLGVGHIHVNPNSDITAQGTGSSGGTINADGAGAFLQAINGGVIATDTSSFAVLNGQTALNGPTTQTDTYTQAGPRNKTSTDAVDGYRTGKPTAWDSNIASLDPTAWDMIEVPFPSADRTWTLVAPPGGVYTWFRIRPTQAASGAKKLTLVSNDGNAIGEVNFDTGSNSGSARLGSMLVEYVSTGIGSGKAWRVTSVSGNQCKDLIIW